VLVTFTIAYILRFNFELARFPAGWILPQIIVATVLYTTFILVFHSYTGLLRHTTLTDITLVFVSTTAAGVTFSLSTLFGRLLLLDVKFVTPISIILIHYVLITVYLFSTRLAAKVLFTITLNSKRPSGKRVLIYGAGEMGFIVKRVILSDPRDGFFVIGFIDDNRKLQGKKINGIKVFSPDIIERNFLIDNGIKTLIIAIRNLPPKKKSEIIENAIRNNIEVLEAPAVENWLNGHLELRHLKKVNLIDLLGREPIKLDMDIVKSALAGKTIMVTGAAGSIGSELIRQLSMFDINKIILVDQAETPIFLIDFELRKQYGFARHKIRLADVTNIERMELIFKEYRPDIIFHAAAYKHVHLMEESPHEAFRVNAGGTKVIADLSEKYGAEKFVMISTDKSVNPTNIMGASKHICELIVQAKALNKETRTQFIITRFGNVLGSNGSVVPLFQKQIMEGGPLTVTHPDINRYFMTIPEACELVLEAGSIGNGGEIFVFDMGTPIKIYDLACNMIKLSGLVPEKDIKIEFIGLRPGEKLYEEPLSDNENLLPTRHQKIKVARPKNHDYINSISKINASLKNLYRLSEEEIIDLFEELVPEYKRYPENIVNEIKTDAIRTGKIIKIFEIK
jgi:FlaA1/EpsC-like NDP-sugar epimerase